MTTNTTAEAILKAFSQKNPALNVDEKAPSVIGTDDEGNWLHLPYYDEKACLFDHFIAFCLHSRGEKFLDMLCIIDDSEDDGFYPVEVEKTMEEIAEMTGWFNDLTK